ncbi:MAG TPA: hypothetical protein VJ020_13890 [Anaerolineales bacterium]|nr:hypothetical protein [Anaerolineales bacterium]
MNDSNVSRRDFIQKAALFTGAGLAVGGAAAVGKEVWDSNQDSAVELRSLQTQLGESATQIAQLQGSLAAAEAELNQVRPQYASALSLNAELQTSLTTQQQDLDAANGTLAEMQAKLEKLTQLVGMYDKLETNAFDVLVKEGLTAAAASFAGALALLPFVSDGIKLARSLLDGFEFQLPNFRAGLAWLKKRMDEMTASITTVEKAILQALKTLDPVAAAMSQLVEYILKYLPANIAAGVKGALDAVDLLYQSLPAVIVGAHDQVIEMLTEPFDEGEKGYGRTLIQPIREKALIPSERLASQVKALNDAYTTSLHEPVRQRLDTRATVLKEIAEFRVANNI